MENKVRLKLPFQLLLILGCLVFAFILVLPFWGDKLDRGFYDTFFKIRGPLAEQSDIIIVGIDDASFQQIQQQWPLPRSLHAELLNSLTEARARVVVFDVLFDTKSRDSMDDTLFAEALTHHQNVILASAFIITKVNKYTQTSWLDPVLSLTTEKNSIGAINLPIDADGVVRRAPLVIKGRESLGYLAAKQYSGEANLQLPAENNRPFLINYSGSGRTIPAVSYYQAIDPKNFLPKNTFKDKLVFIGSTTKMSSTPNLPDHFLTPFSQAGSSMSGVEIHANIALNLLQGNYIKQTSLPVLWIGLVCAFLCGLVFFPVSPSKGVIVLAATSGASIMASYLLFTKTNSYIPIISFLVPAGTGYLGSVCAHYYEMYTSEKRSRILLEQSEKRIQEILATQQQHALQPGTNNIIKTAGSTKTKIFISYKHQAEDANYMAEILDFLKGLSKEGMEFWTDKKLRLGEHWDQEIQQQLMNTDIALVLVSQAYLDSDFCINTEIKSFIERNVMIMPIILSPCELDRHAWLHERQYLPSNGETLAEHYQDPGKRKRMFLEIRDELRRHAEKKSNRKQTL